MILALFLLPLVAAIVVMLLRVPSLRRGLLVGTAALHTLLTVYCWYRPPVFGSTSWLGLDPVGRLFLGITSVLFLAISVYTVHSLSQTRGGRGQVVEVDTGAVFVNAPEAIYIACLLAFLSTMTLVTASQQLGLLWVAVEATTLATAPLIFFHRQPSSLEATWKYLLVCSVGIALALLGNFLVVVASGKHGLGGSLLVGELLERGESLDPAWLKAGFVFLLVGYGTKMGLAPMHTWLPDAHSEAPSPVSALLSGALLNCAFLGILRAHSICVSAGLADFSKSLLIALGLISMALAAAFIVNQPDFKRMLAYSSVEHMGLLAFGTGIGGAAVYGALFHAVNHSLIKAGLFLLAGNLIGAYHSKHIGKVAGAARVLPFTGALWLAGVFAITGMPPFGTFASEFMMFWEALASGHVLWAALALLALGIAFAGMSRAFFAMALGPKPQSIPAQQEAKSSYIPTMILFAMSILLALWMPQGLEELLTQASQLVEGAAP